MRSQLRLAGLLVPVLALVLVGACARRPDLRVAAAPAPAPSPAPQASPPAPPPPAAAAPAPAPPAAAAPAPPPAAPKEFAPNAALRPIHFDFDKSNIRPGDEHILDANAGWLRDNRSQLLLIEGHADDRGTSDYNLALGERRATSTRSFLVSRGVGSDRITIVSYGEEKPLCTAETEACWAQNRRAMFLTKER